MYVFVFINKRFSKRNEIIDLCVYCSYGLCDDIFEIKCHVTIEHVCTFIHKKTFF